MDELQATEPTTSEAAPEVIAESAPQTEATPQEGGLTAEAPQPAAPEAGEAEGLSAPAEEKKEEAV